MSKTDSAFFFLLHICDTKKIKIFMLMNYVSIVNLVFFILGIALSIYLFHFIFFALSAVFHRKRYPKVEEKCRYGIIISAKDEETVIARLIKSIRDANYPQDKLDIFVIAHNCKDKTADIAKSLGANVIVDNNAEENTLGQAYHYAFKRIKDITSYDGFIFFNADNTVDKEYFTKLNEAFVFYNKKDVVTTFRHSLNMNDGVLPSLYSYYFATSCLLAFSGRNNFNVSGRITGCGFVVPSYRLVDGWNYLSITEDIEFSADSILNGKTIRFCYEATFYDEQPIKMKTMWFQRLRWAKGQQIVSKLYFPKLFRALFSRKHKNKMSIYTSMSTNSFVTLVVTVLFVLQLIALLLSPLFGISLHDTFLYWDTNQTWYYNLFMSFNLGALFNYAKSFIIFVLSGFITVIAVLISGREKYKGYSVKNKIGAFLTFPFFMMLQFPLDIVALFNKKVEWKIIPHGDPNVKQ